MWQEISVVIIVLGALAYLGYRFSGISKAKSGSSGGCHDCKPPL